MSEIKQPVQIQTNWKTNRPIQTEWTNKPTQTKKDRGKNSSLFFEYIYLANICN